MNGQIVINKTPWYTRLFEWITLRRHYQEKYRTLYLSRIANLIDYLDKEKATILVGELRERKVDLKNGPLLICGDYISVYSNTILCDGREESAVIRVKDARAISITHNLIEGNTDTQHK